MEPWSYELRGRFDEGVFDSEVLRGNALGDPHRRPVWVYLPPGYDGTTTHYPSVYLIQGVTKQPIRKSTIRNRGWVFPSRASGPSFPWLVGPS